MIGKMCRNRPIDGSKEGEIVDRRGRANGLWGREPAP